MTKATAIRKYRKYSVADYYIIGFVYGHNVYVIEVKDIAPRFIRVEKESSKKGGKSKLQLRLRKKDMEYLIRKGAMCLGNESLLDGEYNKGVELERLVYSLNGQAFRGKDSVGFWVSGDIEIDGKQVQVKLNGAQIAVFDTLKNLDKKAKKGLTKSHPCGKIKGGG